MNSNVGDIFTTLLLLGFSALFSGLSLGLLSLSPQELKRKMELGSREAALIYPLRERGNQLLVTLLIGNVLVNSMFSIYLGKRTAGLIAVIASTVLITIFGEIIPQAVFSRHALRLGSKVAPLVDKFMLILSPIAYPLSLMLDRTLGAELPPIFSKDELIKIVEEHSRSSDSDVEEDELRIVENALNFGDKLIEEVMTPRSVIEAIDQDEVISPVILDELHKTGFNRFPVYEGSIDKVVGTLFLRDLVQIKDKITAKDAMEGKAYFVNEKEKLDDVLNAFFKTKHHMFVVINEFSEVVGLITIEDVIEEILGKQIVDEFDQYEDMRIVAKKQAQKAKQ
jgi:metal transporter CNNM